MVMVTVVMVVVQIYSKVNNTLRVELWNTNTAHDVLINKVLVDEKYAVKCEEHYQSKVSETTPTNRCVMLSLVPRLHPLCEGRSGHETM